MSKEIHELSDHHAALTLTREVKELTKEISNLKNQEFMKVFVRPWKFIWFSFLKGLMIGFGEVLGASVLVAIFIYVLSQVKLVPYVGDFVQGVINEIQFHPQGQPTQATPAKVASPSVSQTTTTKTVTK